VRPWWWAAPVLAACSASGCAGGGAAGPGPEPAADAGLLRDDRVAVLHDARASALAAALVFPGSGWELPGTEGLTLLTAETLVQSARSALEALDAHATVHCDRAAFTIALVAPPDRGDPALDVLLDALFHPAPTRMDLDTARARLRATLALDHANPAWQARLAARQALYTDTLAASPWSGPGCGVPEILDRFDLDQLRAGAYRFAPRMAHVAVIGPDEPRGVHRRVRDRLSPPDDPPPPLPAPREVRAGHRYVERNTVTAWTALAFPFDTAADIDAILGLAALIEDGFGPGVNRPDMFAIDHELERNGGGGALIVYLVTSPEAAAAYADDVAARVAALGGGAVPATWERLANRHHGVRLLERERPETRAAAMAMELALGRAPGTGWPDPAVTAGRVGAAAAALGRPARAVVGPRAARPGAP
jgi:predicted Zn-dependent peptidase